MGCELAVELSDHSITIKMDHPNKNNRAWDENLYRKGNVFHSDYANPIKPQVDHNKGLKNPDEVHVQEGNSTATDGGKEEQDQSHVQMISSPRYRDYMTQDLISQLLTPDERWKLLAYAVAFTAFLAIINIMVSLSAAGVL